MNKDCFSVVLNPNTDDVLKMSNEKELVARRVSNLLSSRPTVSTATAGWISALALLIIALALVSGIFHETAWSIVSIWLRSETYAHGFLIIPISLLLVWDKRQGLKVLIPKPSGWPLLLFFPIGFCWLVAHLVDTLVVQQFAFVAMLTVTIWAVLGHRITRYLAFPILFLFMGVPVGEGLIYPMMNFTADFTVGMLEITGIPVYREGTFFTIPSGRWSVVEACSGMRYLIASVTLGVIFAYLFYSYWWKRVLFVAFSILIPIIANGFRAYMIVMIGHLSGMKLAVGIDHYIYGWVFFGIVMLIMFSIGVIWRDEPVTAPVPDPAGEQILQPLDAIKFLSLVAAAGMFWPMLGWALSDHGGPVARVAVTAPTSVNWTLNESKSIWDWRPDITGADGSIYAFYRSSDSEHGNASVGLYLGIYRKQRQGAELVSSRNMMVRQGHPVWSDTVITSRTVSIGSRNLLVQQHQLLSRRGERLLVWTWFMIGNHHTANPYIAKLLEAKSRLLGRHGEAALIAVAAPYSGKIDTAEQVLTDFIHDLLPAVQNQVRRSLKTDD